MSTYFDFVEEKAGVRCFKMLSNGLEVLLLKDQIAPVVGFQITYHVGSRNEATGHTGATHLLEHLMFKGSKNFNKEAGNNIDTMERYGAILNATTWLDRTNYYMILPKDHLDKIIAIEADRMRDAFIAEKDRQDEMPVVRNEFEQGENNPISALCKQIFATVYQAHPYHHDTIGWRSDIENVSIERLQQFYRDFYWPNNATITVVGDFDESTVLNSLQASFGHIPASAESMPEIYTQEPEQEGERRLVLKRPAPGQAGGVCMTWRMCAGLDADYMPLSVLSHILSEGKSSRMHKALVDTGLALSYEIFVPALKDPGVFFIYINLAPGTTHAQAEMATYKVLEEVIANGVSQSEIAKAQRAVKVGHTFAADSIAARLSALNEAIAVGDWRFDLDYQDKFNKVTSADIQAVAKHYLREDWRTCGYFIPTGGEE